MKYIALHHTASLNTGSPQLFAVDRYHKGKWNDKSELGWYVGYNFFCDTDGTRTNTRRVGEETIANKGHNCNIPENCDTISYCMAGDFRTQKPTPAQDSDFRRFVNDMKEKYAGIKVVGHRDIQAGRTCPELPREYMEGFNKELDTEDREKEETIKLLQMKLLDLLRQLLRRLVALTE